MTSRVFVFTVGTSILRKRHFQAGLGDSCSDTAPIDAACAFNQPLVSFRQDDKLDTSAIERIQRYYREYAHHPTLLPAEFATVRLEVDGVDQGKPDGDRDLRIPVKANDKAFLLASDTRQGEFCAQVDQAMLSLVKDLSAEVKVLQGLRATQELNFEQAAATSLSTVLVEAWNSAVCRQAVLSVHLNGGYKATLPFLIYLLGHLPADSVHAEAFVQHEDSRVPIRIPVRQTGVDARLRADLEAVTKCGTVRDGRWLNYAYVKNPNGRYKLTFLGQAISGLAELG